MTDFIFILGVVLNLALAIIAIIQLIKLLLFVKNN